MSVLVIYHRSCLDGFGAAYAAWRKYPNAEFIPIQYGETPPDVTGRDVFILDFSFKRDVLQAMYQQAKSLQVIDHHKTAQEDLEGLDYALFDMSKSGAMLAWEYFHPGKHIPILIHHIQDRDLWQFKFATTKAVTSALYSMVDWDFYAWHEYMTHPEKVRDLTDIGTMLLKQFDAELKTLEKRKHPIALGGYPGMAVNTNAKYSSELGNLLAQSAKYGATYAYDGSKGEWQFSLRSIGDFDVSEIAKIYGGGGHRNAAGFAVKELRKEWL